MKQKMTKYMSFFIFLFMLMLPIKVSAAVAAPEYTFTTLDGTTISTNGTGYKATVLIFGSTTCGNTAYTLSDVANSDWAKDPNIRVIFAEIQKASKESVQTFVNECGSSHLPSCYDTGSGISGAMWTYIMTYYGSASTASMPITVLIDGSNNIQDVHYNGAQTADDIITEINKFAETDYVPADPYYGKTVDLTISGTEDYVSANTVFTLVNQARGEQGLVALNLDKALTETAMQRAAELAVYYDHIRPDGSSCFTIFPNQSGMHAENIAAGYKTAASVMNGWLNSAGHYANIMNADMHNIGIGCFVDDRGTCYWVQCFSTDTTYTDTPITNNTVTRTITAKVDNVKLFTVAESTYTCQDKTTETQMVIRNINTTYSVGVPMIAKEMFTYTSSNPSVAEVDANGKITLKGVGTVQITATLKGDVPLSVSTTIEKKDHQIVTTDKKSYCTSCNTIFWESASNDNDTNINTNGNTNISGNGNTQTQVSLKKPKLKKVTAKKKSMAVSWNKVKNATGYEISYSLKSNFKSAKKVRIGKGSTTKKTIKKLKKNKRYYVRIRAYRSVTANGKTQKVYSAWSSKKRSGKIK